MAHRVNTTNRVVWREGSLIVPQHFQQQERYLINQIQQNVQMLIPFPWGVERLEIDHVALRQGEFRVNSLRAIMPDGLKVALGTTDPHPPVRQFNQCFSYEATALTVYLGVPVETPSIPSYDLRPEQLHDPQRSTRFSVCTQDQFDRTSEYKLEPVETASVRARIFFGKEPKEGFTILSIARILRVNSGFALDRDYMPPSLTLGPGASIRERVLSLLVSAQHRIVQLEQHRTQDPDHHLEINPRDTGSYIWLLALAARIAGLKALVQAPNLSPYSLYRELCLTEGQLSVLAPETKAKPTFNYDHNNLQHTLIPLIQAIQQHIDVPLQMSFLSVDLILQSNGTWMGALETNFVKAKGDFVLAITSEEATNDMATRFPRLAKLASPTRITGLIDSALSGVTLSTLRQPPKTVPNLAKTMYFSIDRHDTIWREIIQQKRVALHVGAPFDHPNMEIRLIVGIHRGPKKFRV